MKLKHLSTAMILATLPATGVFAAALDRSGQSMSAFFQPGNYFEAGISVLDLMYQGKIPLEMQQAIWLMIIISLAQP